MAHRAVSARVAAYEYVSERRWNLILNDGVVVKLPETGWRKELDALEHLIVDDGILERDVTEIDLRSPTHYFFVLRGGEKKDVQRGKRDLRWARRSDCASTMKSPPTAPAWCRRWMWAPPRSPASSAAPSRAALKILGSALARKRRHSCGHRHQPGAGRRIHPRLRGGGGKPCRCPHPECADLGQLRPARFRSPAAR